MNVLKLHCEVPSEKVLFYTAPWVEFNPTHLGLGWVWVGFWVGLQRRKPNPEKTQPINPNPENSGLTQYIQIVMVVFIVVSVFSPSNMVTFSPSNMVTFSPSNEAVSRLLIWSLSRLLIWLFSRLLI